MHATRLVQMANQIGQFFEYLPDRPEAIDELAQHLQKFWAPSLRAALLAHCDSKHPPLPSPLVQEALRLHRDRLTTSPHPPPPE